MVTALVRIVSHSVGRHAQQQQPSEASFQIHTPDAPSLLDEVVEIGGKGQAVAIFDLDGRWDTHRLASMMRSHYERRTQEHVQDGREQIRQGQVSSKEIEAKVEAALTRILLFQPTSLVALAASLRNLSNQADELLLPSDNLSLVLIDSISATLFQDRWDMEQAKQAAEVTPPTNANKSNDAPPPMPTQHPIRYVLRALGALRQERGITTFMTSAAFTPLTAKSRFYRPAVPPPYPSPFAEDAPKQTKFCSDDPCSSLGIPLPITHHITMHAMPIPQLPKSTTRHQIFGDEGQKRGYTAENQQVLRGFLRVAGVGAVSQDGSAFAGTFDMRVTAAGLEA